MVRIVDLQQITAADLDSDDYFTVSNMRTSIGTYGTARVSVADFFSYINGGYGGLVVNNTDDVPEGLTNKYFTESRSRSSISVSGSLSYNSSTGVISYTQPTNVSSFTNDAGYLTDADTLNSDEAIALIDSSYVRLRQDYRYSSLTGAPTNVSSFTNDVGYLTDADTLNSDEAIQLIDSAYIRLRQDYRYSSLTGAPTNVSSFTNDAGYLTDADTLDSTEAIALIDSAYVRLRQDYRYSVLTGAPTNVSSFTNDVGYLTDADTLDSAEAIALIDSAYINLRVDYGDNNVIQLVDSAYVKIRIGEVGIDSGSILELIDSAYVKGIADNSYVESITDPLYVSLAGDSMTGTLWVDGDIYASGNITGFSTFSDIDLKENFELIENATEKVQTLSGYTFNYKGQPSKRLPGVIAQDVEKILPEAVYEAVGGKKAVLYGNMIALLIESIKELKDEIEELKNERN